MSQQRSIVKTILKNNFSSSLISPMDVDGEKRKMLVWLWRWLIHDDDDDDEDDEERRMYVKKKREKRPVVYNGQRRWS